MPNRFIDSIRKVLCPTAVRVEAIKDLNPRVVYTRWSRTAYGLGGFVTMEVRVHSGQPESSRTGDDCYVLEH